MHPLFFGEVNEFLPDFSEYSSVAVLTDEHTHQFCYPKIAPHLPEGHSCIQIPAGEKHKSLETCQLIWEEMTKSGLDRRSLLLNVGGGVVGDMGGFCAATYMRGIAFVQIPTTLLAQVDASVGGKLGVDFRGLKNHIGLFQLPERVIVDTQFLHTLPTSEWRSGFAEVLKHALIRDHELWQTILQEGIQIPESQYPELVRRAVKVKEKIVAEDPKEQGVRKLLNYGHTFGHALEGFFLEDAPERGGVLHGEAVAAGIVMENEVAHRIGLLSEERAKEISNFIFEHYEKINFEEADEPKLLERMKKDKKNKNGRILLVQLQTLGEATWDVEASEEALRAALKAYREA